MLTFHKQSPRLHHHCDDWWWWMLAFLVSAEAAMFNDICCLDHASFNHVGELNLFVRSFMRCWPACSRGIGLQNNYIRRIRASILHAINSRLTESSVDVPYANKHTELIAAVLIYFTRTVSWLHRDGPTSRRHQSLSYCVETITGFVPEWANFSVVYNLLKILKRQ